MLVRILMSDVGTFIIGIDAPFYKVGSRKTVVITFYLIQKTYQKRGGIKVTFNGAHFGKFHI